MIERIKIGKVHLAKVALNAAVSSVTLLRPSGVAADTPAHVADVTDKVFSVAFEPDEVGRWALFVEGASVSQAMYFDVRPSEAIEDAYGIVQVPRELTAIAGVDVPASTELSGTRCVAATPEWVSRSWGINSSSVASGTTEQTFLNIDERSRVPYTGMLTGVRVKASVNISDLSGTDITKYVVCAFEKRGSDYYLRGRSENVDKSRLVASGGYYYLKFHRPFYVCAGDYVGINTQTSSGGPSITDYVMLQEGVKASGLNGATDATGLIFTDAGATFQSDGVSAGDNIGLGSADNAIKEVASVDSETQLTLTSATSTSLTGINWQVATSSVHSVSSRKTGAISDTAGNTFGNAFSLQNITSLPIDLIMNAPHVVIAGTSIEEATDNTENVIGGMQDSHHQIPYDPTIDLAETLHQATGLTCVTAARGGANFNNYIGGDDARTYLGPQMSSVLAYAAGAVLLNTTANDVSQGWSSSGGRDAFLDRLDKVLIDLAVAGSELIWMTGTPVPERSSSQQETAQSHRLWASEWASLNQARLLETHRALWQSSASEATENILNDDDSINSESFPTLSTTTGGGNVHHRRDGYRVYAETIARMLRVKSSSAPSSMVQKGKQYRYTASGGSSADVTIGDA